MQIAALQSVPTLPVHCTVAVPPTPRTACHSAVRVTRPSESTGSGSQVLLALSGTQHLIYT